ncbi:peptidyl-prolyl cis-trans isomerase [Sulfurimonas sp.]|uniref:peptidylprolyl isomerase n=1 Tax=Sulfurimonas sp. TaxID=2022749 RepID=UPI00260AE4EA|nr:peptidyl-prolyl cis-trans isomerase [Sulfurimonas sp.]
MNKVTMLLSALLLTGSMAYAKTLVTVNGKAITQADVNTELMSATQGRVNQIPAARLAMFKKQVLQQLIGKEIIFDDAKKSGILNSPEYKNEYNKLLNRMKKELAIQVWQKKLLGSIKITNKELKDYYNKNKDEFNEKESVHARHILVKTKAEAEKIISELKGLSGQKLKEKFIELAKKDSTGPSGPKGGDLGYFAQGQMVPAFNSKVFSMKKGTITLTPVKTQFGYHVIYLEDKKPAMTRTFNEVKTFIEQRLKMEKFKKVFKQKMDKLEKNAVIVNN